MELSEQNALEIKQVAWLDYGLEICLEQAEIILIHLNNRFSDGWGETELGNELHYRYAN